MKKTIGTVMEIFIPKEYKNGILLDVMDRTKLGFKIKTKEGIREIIVEANEINSSILKNDPVMILEQTISNKEFIDIEPCEGEDDDEE